jgi:putative hydrolase of the HAD superfamily
MQYSSRRERPERPIDRVIVLDLDDTLYLERDYVASGFRAVGRWAGTHLGVPDLEAVMRALFEEGLRHRIFDEALAAVGIAPSPALITRMVAVYRQHRPSIRLEPDAERLWARAPPRTAFALITDGPRDSQKRKIRALRLHRRGVQLAICTDRWGREAWKPNPMAFVHVQAFFGLPANRFAYVADNPVKDFIAPRDLGWRTVRIDRPRKLHTSRGAVIDADESILTLDVLNLD